jgi:hypothetical protein
VPCITQAFLEHVSCAVTERYIVQHDKMSAQPVSLQWSLQETANSALSVARGVVSAATSDNIQALALLACERFGATLAMCPETCDKIERLVIKVPMPVRIFIGAYIGYSAGDSAAQLVKNKAGVQFLALAAALATTTGSFQGGLALEIMLENSATDKTLLPTSRQLKDLLAVLEHRLVASRFADVVVYCWNLLSELPPNPEDGRNFWKVATFYPDPDGVAKLVDAFRQLNRIGDATSLQLKATSCAPWVIAFTKWCLGIFPTIQLGDGTIVLEQPTSSVTVIASMDYEHCPGLEITIHRDLRSPADLITAKWTSESWTGMVSLAQYWQWLRQEYNFGLDLAIRCLAEVLPYALHQTVVLLRTSPYGKFDNRPPLYEWQPLQLKPGVSMIDEESLSLIANPFPADTIIADMLSKFLGLSNRVELQPLPPGTLLVDLPIVALYVADLRKTCTCKDCTKMSTSKFKKCDAKFFFDRLAFIVADVLSLSLFELPDNLLVHLKHHHVVDLAFKAAIHSILTTGVPEVCNISHILKWTLALIGHDIEVGTVEPGDQRKWVLSSEKGQVAYPRVFETHNITSRGYLTLSWAPGILRYQNQIYPKGVSQPSTSSGRDPITQGNETLQVDKPRNLLPAYELAWLVAQRDGYLEISVSLRNETNQRTSGNERPYSILRNIAESLVLEACQHAPSTLLNRPDGFSAYTGPLSPQHHKYNSADGSNISCVAVEGNTGLALLTLSALPAPFPMVIRGKACLECALGVCRRSTFVVLIL